MSASATTTAAPPIDLARVLPLTGRRAAARAVLLLPFVTLAAGVVAAAAGGRATGWSAILSAPVPGLGQLVQGRVLVGVLFLLAGLIVWVAAIMRSYGWALFLLVPWAVVDAATLGSRWSLPVAIGIGLAGAATVELVTKTLRDRRIAAFRAAQRSAGIASSAATPAHLVPVTSGPAPALDRNTEAYLRWISGFGAAAPDDWSVFDDPKHVDSALRYQMAVSGWAIHHFQHQHTPAYRESAGTALGNLAERGRHPKVWGYTFRENLKGLRIDGDPFERENVMYAGYLANVIGMFEAMTGDHRYDEPGGYSVSNGRRTYEWDHHRIVEQLALQHAISPMGSITCFPGWLWPACQTFSLRGIQLADLTHGTDHGHAVERFVEAFPKWFMEEDGSILTCRHVTGVKHPVDHLVVGLTGQAATGLFAGAFDASLIHRNYEAQVLPRLRPADDGLELELSRLDTYDTSYGWNPGMPYSFALLYATELGDHDTAAGLRATLEQMLTPDEARPGPGSQVSMAITLMALINSQHALAAGHRHAPCQDTTPELASAPWPRVIVSHATTDGTDLDIELLAGPAANGSDVELSFARLAPGAAYRAIIDDVAGELITADGGGSAQVACSTPRERTRIQLTRAG